jgi:hypothetical protein
VRSGQRWRPENWALNSKPSEYELPTSSNRKIKQTIAVFASSPAEFRKFLAAENEKWGKVIRAANIKL